MQAYTQPVFTQLVDRWKLEKWENTLKLKSTKFMLMPIVPFDQSESSI